MVLIDPLSKLIAFIRKYYGIIGLRDQSCPTSLSTPQEISDRCVLTFLAEPLTVQVYLRLKFEQNSKTALLELLCFLCRQIFKSVLYHSVSI